MTFFGSGKGLLARLAVVAVGVAASSAVQAGLSPVIFSVTASNANGTGTYNVAYDPGLDDPSGYFWSQLGPVTITDGDGDEIATVELANFSAFGDPAVGMSFTVQALGAPTTFSINSGVLSYAPISNASGIASGGLTATDSDTNAFASLVGNIGSSGTRAFVASYNGGTIFGEDVPPLSVNNPAGSDSDNFNTGLQPIGGAIFSMQVDFGFVLSANDSASGTSVFFVVPEPTTMILMGLGLALIRRR